MIDRFGRFPKAISHLLSVPLIQDSPHCRAHGLDPGTKGVLKRSCEGAADEVVFAAHPRVLPGATQTDRKAG